MSINTCIFSETDLNSTLLTYESAAFDDLLHKLQVDPAFEMQLWHLLEASKQDPAIAIAAANAATLLNAAGFSFSGRNFSGVQIPGAQLGGAILEGTDLSKANLRGVVLTNAWLRQANFQGALLHDLRLGELPSLFLKGECQFLYCPSVGQYDTQGRPLLSLSKGPYAGKQLLAIKSKNRVLLYDGLTLKTLKPFYLLTGSVDAMAFSPDGQYLITAKDNILQQWRLQDRKCIRTYQGPGEHRIQSLACSPDGQLLASGSRDYTLKLWSVSTGQCVKTCTGHEDYVNDLAFSPDGKWLVSASADQTLKLWTTDGECIQTFTGHRVPIYSCAFSPNGQWIASAGGHRMSADPGEVKCWKVQDGTCLQTYQGHEWLVSEVAFSPDSNQLASASWDQTVKRWQVSTGQCLQTYGDHRDLVLHLKFSPDGKRLMSSSTGRNSCLKRWNIEDKALLKKPAMDLETTHALALNGWSKRLAVATRQSLKVLQIPEMHCIKTYMNSGEDISALAFNPDATLLACAFDESNQNVLRIRRFVHEDWLECKSVLGSSIIICMTFSPDSCYLSAVTEDGDLGVWRVLDGYCLWIQKQPKMHVDCMWSTVAFSPDSQMLLVCGGMGDDRCEHRGGIITAYRTLDGHCLKKYEGHERYVSHLVFSPDGQTFLSASWDNTVKWWNVQEGQCLGTYQDAEWISRVAFHPAGDQILFTTFDDRLKWLHIGKKGFEIMEQEIIFETGSEVLEQAFSEDGRYFAVRYRQDAIRLWGPCASTQKMHLLWDSHPICLEAKGLNLRGATGLSSDNKKVLVQGGALL